MPRRRPARVPFRRRNRPVVLVLLDGWHPGWPDIVRLARERDWRLLDLRYTGGELTAEEQPQGAIVDCLPGDPLVRRLLKRGCPVVRLGSLPHPRDERVPAVMPDWDAAGRLAVAHFAERSFKHVGYVGFNPWSDKKVLYEGLRAGAEALGVQCHLFRFKSMGGHSAAELYRIRRPLMDDWLRGTPRPIGLLGFVDGMAATLCCMCRESGYMVPGEVAILGYGNVLPACEGTLPTLSSIEPDPHGMVEAAVRLLQQRMEGEPGPARVKVPPKGIVTRESTDMLAVADRHVAAALRFMWDHLDRDLGVADVAREAGVARRTLERGFRQALQRSVNEELRRKRLEQFRVLLRDTNLSVTDLACKVGFHSSQHLHRAFFKDFGKTPLQYRKECRVPSSE